MELQNFSFPNDKAVYITPTWNDLEQLAFEVAEQIRSRNIKFDRIVTLAKGGWPMTRSLVDFLMVPEVASIGVKFYKGINQRLNMPEIYQDLPISVRGEKVLLFDDVADTGESLEFTKKYLLEHGVAEVTTATLFYKPHSQFKPDFYGSQITAWIIFPYDAVEMIKVLGGIWLKQGIDEAEIKNRFLQLGFTGHRIDSYFYLANMPKS
jgi:hypoxanthine phosphoribosyltransferase